MEISIVTFISYSVIIIAISICTGWLWGQVSRMHKLESTYDKVIQKQRQVILDYEQHIRSAGDGWKFGLK